MTDQIDSSTAVTARLMYDLADPAFELPGRVLVFNQAKFDALLPRGGTEHDVRELESVFRALRFLVEVCHDLSVTEIQAKLQNYSEMDHSRCGCLVVVVLSHGSSGFLWGKDGEYRTSLLWERISACNSLVGKPKLFFVQACQASRTSIDGDTTMYEEKIKVPSPTRPVTAISRAAARVALSNANWLADYGDNEDPPRLPDALDVLVAFSSVRGRVATRGEKQGSWFIQALCRHLLSLAHTKDDLLTLLTRVNNEVSKGNAHVKDTKINFSQTSVFVSTLTRDVVYLADVPFPQDKSSTTSSVDHASNAVMGSENDSMLHSDGTLNISSNISGNISGSSGGTSAMIGAEAQYDWQKVGVAHRGRALLYHDAAHAAEARQLAEVAQGSLHYRADLRQVASVHEALAGLNRVAAADSFEQEASLVVALLLPLQDATHLRGPLHRLTSLLTATICTTLGSKPKLVFFLDAEHKADEGAPMEVDEYEDLEYDNAENDLPFANEHSDFLVVRGRGPAFVQRLVVELAACLDQPEGVVKMLTRALRPASAVGPEHVAEHVSSIESTLRLNLVFQGTMPVLP